MNSFAAPPLMSNDVLKAIHKAAREGHNPSSVHRPGQQARRAVGQASRCVAQLAGLRRHQVIWTASPLEADVLACLGRGLERRGSEALLCGFADRPFATLADLSSCLESDGMRVHRTTSIIPSAEWERCSLWVIPASCPITGQVVECAPIFVAAQRAGVELHICGGAVRGPLDVSDSLAAEVSMTVDSISLGGPSGLAALVVAKKPLLEPLWRGGGQQEGQRPGTLPRDLIAGMGSAAYAQCSSGRSSRIQQRVLFWRLTREEATRLGCLAQHRGMAARWGESLHFGSGLAISASSTSFEQIEALIGPRLFAQHLTIHV